MDNTCSQNPGLNTFRSWYVSHQYRFLIPLRQISDREWELAASSLLVTTAVRDSLVVTVRNPADRNDRWDEIAEFDAVAAQTSDGWICTLCRDIPRIGPAPPKVYGSREMLLIDHVYEPFLAWVNNTLHEAKTLALYDIGDGFSWAKLLMEEADAEADHIKYRFPLS